MKKYLRHIGSFLIFCIFAGAIYLLYHKLKAYSFAQIKGCVEQIPYWRIGLSFVLMILNYLILVGYDWLALKAIHKKLSLDKTSLVSFVGQAVSYNFGALLGGTTVRYRFYSAWGFSLSEIVRLVLMLAVTFWVGALGLCGIVFILAPPIIPVELLDKMPLQDVRILGVFLLMIALSYLVLCFFIRKPVHIFGKEFVFPPPHIAILQALVAGLDLIVAAACMYVLLPGFLHISFLEFLPSYLMAQVAVVLTHIPGGVGVFELVILHLTHTPQEDVVFAAVLLFRFIYFIVPLFAAALLLAVYEARQRRDTFREAGRWLSVLSHTIAALAVFAAGVICLFSSVLPVLPATRDMLLGFFPPVIPALGHLICVLSGLSLLFLAYGLERRQALAFRWAVACLILAMLSCFFKGFSWIETGIMCIVLVTLLLTRRRFYRRSFFLEERFPFYWLMGIWAVIALALVFAWFMYNPAWDRASIWGFEQYFNASRMLRGALGGAVLLVMAFLWRVICRQRIKSAKKKI